MNQDKNISKFEMDISISNETLAFSEHSRVREELLFYLLSLSFPAFAKCMEELLSQMGYAKVQRLDRVPRRKPFGFAGVDVKLFTEAGVSNLLIVVQLKQYTRPVHCRHVDELRGIMGRTGARQALMISTSSFTQSARGAAFSDKTSPVRLIKGDELLDLMFKHNVGVIHEPPNRWWVDSLYFEELQKRYPRKTTKSKPTHQTDSLNQTSPENLSLINHPQHAVPVLNQLPNTSPSSANSMMWRTHVLVGIASLWLLLPFGIPVDHLGALAIAAAFGSLLPDLDATESKIKSLELIGLRPFVPIAKVVNNLFGHRGFMHSLNGLLLFTIISTLFIKWFGLLPVVALDLGYASHLAADACTRGGIPFLYPLSKKRFYLLPKRFRLVTGSLSEDAIMSGFACLVFLLLIKPLFQG